MPPQLIGRASALENTVKQIAGSLSVTILTIFMQNRQNLHYFRLAEKFNSFSPAALNFSNSAQAYVVQKGVPLANVKTGVVCLAYSYISKEAYMYGIDDVLMLTLIVLAAGIPLAFLIKSKRLEETK